MTTETRPSATTVAHRVWLQIPELSGDKAITKRQIMTKLAERHAADGFGWDFTAAEVGDALRLLRDAGKIAHPSKYTTAVWVRTVGHLTITRTKQARSRLATGPGYAWHWLYSFKDQAQERTTEYGTHLASLVDYLSHEYPTRRIVKVWEAPAFGKCEHVECRLDHVAHWISTGYDDPLCRVEEAEEDIDLAKQGDAHDRAHGL